MYMYVHVSKLSNFVPLEVRCPRDFLSNHVCMPIITRERIWFHTTPSVTMIIPYVTALGNRLFPPENMVILDLSGRGLKRLDRVRPTADDASPSSCTTLILDRNAISKIEHLEEYHMLQQVRKTHLFLKTAWLCMFVFVIIQL